MNNNKPFSIEGRLKSFLYAFSGLKSFFKTEHNAWMHVAVSIGVVIMGSVFKVNNYEWCLLAFAIGLVIVSEIFNTAIELLMDIVSPDYNDKAKIIKDIAAAGVLIASITAMIIGLIVFVL